MERNNFMKEMLQAALLEKLLGGRDEPSADIVNKDTLKSPSHMLADAELAGKMMTIVHLDSNLGEIHKQLLAAWEALEQQKKEAKEDLENQRQEAGQEVQRLWKIIGKIQKDLDESSRELIGKIGELSDLSEQHRIYQGQVTAIRQVLTHGHSDTEAIISKVKEILDFPVPVAEPAAAEQANAK
jgi:hypothetical protein